MTVVRKFLVSIFLAAGLLAITHLSARLEESSDGDGSAQLRLQARRVLQAKLQTSKALRPSLSEMNDRFRDSLLGDEIHEQNPFASTPGLDLLLSRIVTKGVREFKRETFRSPQYKSEFGYDLVHYGVEQMDGSKSLIMAYMEKSDVVVMVVVGENGDRSEVSLFRAGGLVEKTSLSSAQALDQLERKISESVPFLSVSR